MEDIIAALVKLRSKPTLHFCREMDLHGRIMQLVRHLVRARGVKPTPFIYECVMDAMADPQGSASGVRRLLDDMAALKLAPTVDMCEAALAALANHPDYMLRLDVLATMKEHWLPVRTRAKQYVVLGMLRDGQYELAYARLSEMLDGGIVVEAWVLDVFILSLGNLGFVEEMLSLLHRRTASEEEKASLACYALDVCSQAFHHAGTVYSWTAAVQLARLEPPDGTVENVLATAARHGDTRLATQALDVLSRRGKMLTSHYEAVCDAFAQAGDVPGMLRIGRIMHQHGIRFLRPSARVLHSCLTADAAAIPAAAEALRALQPDAKTPPAMVAVILETIAQAIGSEAILDVYANLPLLCGHHPDALLLHALIINARQTHTCRRLADEYLASIPADPRRSAPAWTALISALVDAQHLDLAFRFAAGALGQPGIPARAHLGWVKTLVACAAAREDQRIWPVLDILGRAGGAEVAHEVRLWLRRTRLVRQTGGDAVEEA
ncbi:hypothetical protein CDD81_4239 [Ophiocordyceps australis]|uniref:Pentatricopeptide repeat-containing protein-mitochondrial domain-containing protein n=1 Tax=Ophiocordyceps australis TaxID=1399860 RepID=A0A2C5XJ92_9HYPO|nr:hypothetical protein CDD81_4239 [Ophiocordyceps australis]